MNAFRLLVSSDDRRIDEILRGLVEIYETVMPSRIRGYYLIGSYADRSPVPLSDIDLVILFKGRMTPGEMGLASQLGQSCARLCPVRLDLTFGGEDEKTWEKLHLKLASLLIYGEDVRHHIHLPPIDEAYAREAMAYSQSYLMANLRGVASLTFPLSYPDPDGEFYGYDTLLHPLRNAPEVRAGIKDWINSMSMLAKALVNVQARRYVATKLESITLYRECIGDEWTTFLEAVYTYGKLRWGYAIPDTAQERAHLRTLCQQTLAFENHFLLYYRTFLLIRLRSQQEDEQIFATERLAEVLYPDEEIISALQTLQDKGSEQLQQLVATALKLVRAAL